MHGKNNNRAAKQRIILGCAALSYPKASNPELINCRVYFSKYLIILLPMLLTVCIKLHKIHTPINKNSVLLMKF